MKLIYDGDVDKWAIRLSVMLCILSCGRYKEGYLFHLSSLHFDRFVKKTPLAE
jgi:hypothetical protein